MVSGGWASVVSVVFAVVPEAAGSLACFSVIACSVPPPP